MMAPRLLRKKSRGLSASNSQTPHRTNKPGKKRGLGRQPGMHEAAPAGAKAAARGKIRAISPRKWCMVVHDGWAARNNSAAPPG
jgi:hypothetical protein